MKLNQEVFAGDSQALRIAERVLNECLRDPELAKVFENMLADQTVTKKQLFHTAFAQGVVSTLYALAEGRLMFTSKN